MCGIAGIVDTAMGEMQMGARLQSMQKRLRHRGPDGEGLYIDEASGAGLAHTRLAILDLSPAGRQPMQSPDGRYTIAYNGEAYNFAELREELAGAGWTFRSASDTEVILAAYQQWGEASAARLVGMFAVAIWDRARRRCFLARGPKGIKPLYVWRRGGAMAFASEVRALLEAGLGPRRLCLPALRGYLLFGTVQEPLTLVHGVEMLPPGHTALWRDGQLNVTSYWSFQCGSTEIGQAEAVIRTQAALEASVRRHFVSDVPVSIFLSGGIDSTAIVAVAWRCGFENLQTFSISFDEAAYNEGELAARTAEHFGTRHHDWRMTAADARELFPRFLEALDQPTTDGFNTFCVAKLAHDHGAKVVLSGLGGDEMFGGYGSFRRTPQLLELHRRLVRLGPLRAWLGGVAERRAWKGPWRRAGVYLQSAGGMAAAYWAVRGIFTPAEAERLAAGFLGVAPVEFGGTPFGEEPPNMPTAGDQVSYLETTRYMCNQLLRDSDVMSMAWGLELRVPLVDSELTRALERIPAEHRLATGKRLMLAAVPEIPSWVAEAPKRGFAFPFQRWLGQEWAGMMAETDRRSPVRLGTWYRQWTLFTLEYFLRENRIETAMAA